MAHRFKRLRITANAINWLRRQATTRARAFQTKRISQRRTLCESVATKARKNRSRKIGKVATARSISFSAGGRIRRSSALTRMLLRSLSNCSAAEWAQKSSPQFAGRKAFSTATRQTACSKKLPSWFSMPRRFRLDYVSSKNGGRTVKHLRQQMENTSSAKTSPTTFGAWKIQTRVEDIVRCLITPPRRARCSPTFPPVTSQIAKPPTFSSYWTAVILVLAPRSALPQKKDAQ